MEECCADKSKRISLELILGDTGDMYVEQCSTCGRKHYRLAIKPIKIGATIQPLGGLKDESSSVEG